MDNFDLKKYLEDKLFERRYIGSCVDVGGDDAEVC